MHNATVLPLHSGKAPRWLFQRMVKLARAISLVIIDDFGSGEFLRRLSDRNWFQALSCAIGYDWHSSGTTTVTVGALKEALNDTGEVFIAGGKGKAGLKTPEEIVIGTDSLSIPNEAERFRRNSRLAAKVDSALVYDNSGIYHHSFIFSRNKKWSVIQQAMDLESGTAIRYQWYSELVDENDMANEPHSSIDTEMHVQTLDLTASANEWARESGPEALEEYERIFHGSYPHRHDIVPSIDLSIRAQNVIKRASEIAPKDYEELLLVKGMGRATLRSLAFVSSLIYDKELAYRDPIAFAYNLGGKDGIPFGVPRKTYDEVIESMEHIIDSAKVETRDRYYILKRLSKSLAEASS